MPAALEFTGERFIPGAAGEIAYEHGHRYAFARRFVAGRRVLDAACGTGYGTALLADAAAQAVGIDCDAPTIAHARSAYGERANVRFAVGTVTALPFPTGAFDVVVSFETVEHLAADDQPRMLAEFARVLGQGGVLILSSPNRRRYSDERGCRNPYHRHELDRDGLARLVGGAFAHARWFHQQPLYASSIWREDEGTAADLCEAWSGSADACAPRAAGDGLYYVVIAAASGAAVAAAAPRVSLYTDPADSALARAEADAAEVLRLDALLLERDAALDRQTGHVRHLETLVAERERIVDERDRELAAVNAARDSGAAALAAAQAAHEALAGELGAARADLDAERTALAAAQASLARRESEVGKAHGRIDALERERRELEAALAAQERVIAYQQSLRGWMHTPWVRARHAWQRRFGR